MKNRRRLFALAGSLLLACTVALSAQKGTSLYKWKDKDGATHYGDTIPPEYSTQDRQELNQQGVPVRDLPRQLTPEEAAAARKLADTEDKRRQRDQFLLNTYTKPGDIEQQRDDRLALIDGQMQLTRSTIATNEERLAAQQARLRNFRPYSASATAARVPDQLAAQVVRSLSDRRSLSTQLQQREKERAEQLANFDADLARYKELTAKASSR